MFQEHLRGVLRFAEERPQAEQRGGRSPEEEADRHVREALLADRGERQCHPASGRGLLCPWLFRLNPAGASRIGDAENVVGLSHVEFVAMRKGDRQLLI